MTRWLVADNLCWGLDQVAREMVRAPADAPFQYAYPVLDSVKLWARILHHGHIIMFFGFTEMAAKFLCVFFWV